MDTLTRDVAGATGLAANIANAAVGYVLLFLRDEVPESRIAEFIDKNPLAHEAVQAAAARWDGGVTAAIEGLTSFMGHGRADVNTLAGNLENLGLTAEQINRLVQQIMARAEALVGRDGAAQGYGKFCPHSQSVLVRPGRHRRRRRQRQGSGRALL